MATVLELDYGTLCRSKTREELDAGHFNPNSFVGSPTHPNPMLNALIACEDYHTVACLIQKYSDQIDPNQKDWEGKTALIIAAKMYNGANIVFLLLDCLKHKLNVNAQDHNGNSALHYACAYRKTNTITKLLRYGADSTLKNLKGQQPFEMSEITESELKEILLSIDIDPERDVKALGNTLDWHFRLLRISTMLIYSDELEKLLNAKSTFSNLKTLEAFMELDACNFNRKEQWLFEFGEVENRFPGKTILEEWSSKNLQLFFRTISLQLDEIQTITAQNIKSALPDFNDHLVNSIISFLYVTNKENTKFKPISSSDKKVQAESFERDENEAWWHNEEHFKMIIATAHRLRNQFPNDMLCSLGQSPAYYIKGVEILSQIEGSLPCIQYIPFSGSFLEIITKIRNEWTFEEIQNPIARFTSYSEIPSQKIQSYRKILFDLNLNPLSIVTRYKNEKQRTIILEATDAGSGLASFLYILFSWAQEDKISDELKKSLGIVVLTPKPLQRIELPMLQIAIDVDLRIDKTNDLQGHLSNGMDKGAFSDRLVPQYTPDDWGKPFKVNNDNIQHLKLIAKRLEETAKKEILLSRTKNAKFS